MAFSASVENAGDARVLRVVLENRGATAVWGLGFLDFEDYDCGRPPRASVQIKLTDGAGRTLPSTCQPLVPSYFRKSYRVFKPGDRVTAVMALSSCYQFGGSNKRDGDVEVAAWYQDPNESPEAPPAGVEPLRTRLLAPVVKLNAPSPSADGEPRATLRAAIVKDDGKLALRTTIRNEIRLRPHPMERSTSTSASTLDR